MTSGTINGWMPSVLGRAFADLGIMAIGAGGCLAVRAMANRAVPALVHRRCILLFYHLKAMGSLMAFRAQFGPAVNWLIGLRGIVPK
jgi:hypothetical protein